MNRLPILALIVVVALACNLQPVPRPTDAVPTEPPTVIIPKPVASPTPYIITATPAPTVIPSPTPLGPPMFTANGVMNCRFGPGVEYPVLSLVQKRQTVPIIGKGNSTIDGSLWWVVNDGGQMCWVAAWLGAFSGNPFGIPYFYAPAVPTPQSPTVEIVVKNSTGGGICTFDMYINNYLIFSQNWERREFRDGDHQVLEVPQGIYDEVTAYNCKLPPNEVGSIRNVAVNPGTIIEFTQP